MCRLRVYTIVVSAVVDKVCKVIEREISNFAPPTGTVTLVFTDVQHSTLLWESVPQSMSIALQIHNSIFRANLIQFEGYEVKTEGDSFMIAFKNPVSAVLFCLAVQEALMVAPWPEELLQHPDGCEYRNESSGELVFRGLRVRMGIHTGVPLCQLDPVTGRMDYFGQMVNKAARIAAVACGGQILISETCWEEAKDNLVVGKSGVFRSLGMYKLRDISSEVMIYQALPRNYCNRSFLSLTTSNSRDPSIVKVSGYTLENQMNKLVVDNQSLKRQLNELENRLSDLNDNSSKIASRLSQMKLINTCEMFNINGSNNSWDNQNPIFAGVNTLMNEFENMIQKQEEMRKLVTQVNSNESSLSKQVLVLTEKFNKTMEEDDEDCEVAGQVSKEERVNTKILKQKLKATQQQLSKKNMERNKYMQLYKESIEQLSIIEKSNLSAIDKKQVVINANESKIRLLEAQLEQLRKETDQNYVNHQLQNASNKISELEEQISYANATIDLLQKSIREDQLNKLNLAIEGTGATTANFMPRVRGKVS